METDRQMGKKGSAAFTLMEIMVVVAIIGLIGAMSVPAILQMRREGPMRKAVNDVLELCERARAGAVLKDTRTRLVFHPHDRKIEVEGGDSNQAITSRMGAHPIMSTQFDPSVTIEGLGINLRDYTDTDGGTVNFYDNGTCDEMTLILLCDGHREQITLELTTALPSVKQLE
ncbi:MAG TPA: prepilin-type N-terminal cleavage/methylation domain-containing protein [Verrucomicrobiae bacterium]|jgi:prepilin-type N-terminal cleavage/methylation domain-containing protein|nr:prepilin-type N-terminal cleavage/methylation domain-containing protein [Verrucomicrobiae bacterium]